MILMHEKELMVGIYLINVNIALIQKTWPSTFGTDLIAMKSESRACPSRLQVYFFSPKFC